MLNNNFGISKTPMIISAAIRDSDGVLWIMTPPHRHHDIIRLMAKNKRSDISDQGFIDEHGNFLDRIQAAEIATRNGQCDQMISPPWLTSEDLW